MPVVRVVATYELKLFVAAVIESAELAGLVHLYFSHNEAYATGVVVGLATAVDLMVNFFDNFLAANFPFAFRDKVTVQ